MLTIRTEQLKVLGGPAREVFEQWLARQLAERFPNHLHSFDEAAVAAFVARAVARASGYGITTAAAITGFAGFLVEFGENFENLPDDSEARAILEDREFPGQLKVQLLHECLMKATGGRRLLPPE